MLTNKRTTSHRKSRGNGRASPYKGNKGGGRGRGWRGLSVPCVEIGRPELVGGKASKVRAQPPHSHQLQGMWRQRTRASSAAPQYFFFFFSFDFSLDSTDQSLVSQKASLCNTALVLCLGRTTPETIRVQEDCGFRTEKLFSLAVSYVNTDFC